MKWALEKGSNDADMYVLVCTCASLVWKARDHVGNSWGLHDMQVRTDRPPLSLAHCNLLRVMWPVGRRRARGNQRLDIWFTGA